MAALIAAEIAAGVSEENALTVAAQIPGPLAGLIGEAILHAGKTGLPLLSHETRKGALRTILDDSGSPALRAFGVQLDVAAAKGVEVDERMNELSQSLVSPAPQPDDAQHRKTGDQPDHRCGCVLFPSHDHPDLSAVDDRIDRVAMNAEKRRWEMSLILDIVEVLVNPGGRWRRSERYWQNKSSKETKMGKYLKKIRPEQWFLIGWLVCFWPLLWSP